MNDAFVIIWYLTGMFAWLIFSYYACVDGITIGNIFISLIAGIAGPVLAVLILLSYAVHSDGFWKIFNKTLLKRKD